MFKHYFLTFLILLGFGKLSRAQTTNIPDSNFEQALIDLGIDSDGLVNGIVLSSDISSITQLDVNSKNISSLKGIEGFENLTNLSCYINNIDNLDVSQNTKLITLDCAANQLGNLDLSNNTSLEQLQCDFNNLTYLNITNNNAITFLNCSENQLLFIDLSQKTEIETLECFNNKIKNIDISNSPKLKRLRTSNNQLQSLNVKNGANSILTDLWAVNNPSLTCISVDDPDSANNFGQPYKDWELDVGITYSSSCEASTTSIPDTSFEKLLIETHIDSDGIINGKVLTSEVEIITALSIYYDFNDPNTNFAEVFIATLNDPNGVTFTYEIGRINSFEGIEDFSSLTRLFCDYVELSGIDISNNINLTHLGLTFNNISTIDLSQNTNLEFLHLELQNFLQTLDISNNVKLRHLECSYGAIEKLDLSQNNKLEEFNCLFSNSLSELNLQNGNNQILTNVNASETPQLSCIQVDNSSTANAGNFPYNNWLKDNTAIYSENCFPPISDTNFEQALIDLGIDSDGIIDGDITASDALNVTSLDITSNGIISLMGIESFINLMTLNCSNNDIVDLDLSKNSKLQNVNCSNNQLETLNVKNGNNSLISLVDAINNTSSLCIDVDNESLANSGSAPYDTWLKDPSAIYSEDCKSVLGINDEILASSISFYPNPVNNMLTIDSEVLTLKKVEIYSILGEKVKEVSINFKSIQLDMLSKGIYILKISFGNDFIIKKVIKK